MSIPCCNFALFISVGISSNYYQERQATESISCMILSSCMMLSYKHTQMNGFKQHLPFPLCPPDLPTSPAPSPHTHTHTLTHPLSQSVHGLLQYLLLLRREDIHANLHGGYKLLHLCCGNLLKILVGEDGLHVI